MNNDVPHSYWREEGEVQHVIPVGLHLDRLDNDQVWTSCNVSEAPACSCVEDYWDPNN